MIHGPYNIKFLHHVPQSAVIVTHTVLRNIYEHNIFHTGLVIQDAREYVNCIVILIQIKQHKLKVIFISLTSKLNFAINRNCLNEQQYIKYNTMLAASWSSVYFRCEKKNCHLKSMCNKNMA